MTTIACNKECLAADLQFTYGDLKMRGKTKVIVLEGEHAKCLLKTERAIIGFCGHAHQFAEFVNWCVDTDIKKPPKLKRIELLALTKEGNIYTGAGPTHWVQINQDFFSIGSGSHFALGALQQGVSPLEAVKTASKHDINTGMGFQEFYI